MLYLVLILIFSTVLIITIQRGKKFKKESEIVEFPAEWVEYMKKHVKFYNKITPDEQEKFKSRVLRFINSTRIIGYAGMPITDIDKLLVGVSAIIPIFRFSNWEYNFLHEVILVPKAIPGKGAYKGSYINGLVGDGAMEGRMILAKTALHHGYSNTTDRINVGVHEFAHIVDKQDGEIDGVPNILLDDSQIGPWVELIRTKSKEIKKKKAKINNYALTNDAEFFAVVTEYFFEHPEMMVKKHPELYRTLEEIYS
tara:strand:+ start:163 stop:924 length:762 start_codon:yes stop_codon:yes gene_type:complete